MIGSVSPNESVVGPGNTLSVISRGGDFQSLTLDGSTSPANPDGTSSRPFADLGGGGAGGASVGLYGARPVAVYEQSGLTAAVRQYDGSGDLNAVGNWTAPVAVVGPLSGPQLAGGPTGLFVLGLDGILGGKVLVRRFDGTTFGAPVDIGRSVGLAQQDLFQDPAGRLHAIWPSAGASTVQLVHAVSDDGTTWSSGSAVVLPIQTTGSITEAAVATAADHIGFPIVRAGGDDVIAAVPVGPGAPPLKAFTPPPLPPAPPATPPPGRRAARINSNQRVVLRLRSFEFKVAGSLGLKRPGPMVRCGGTLRVSLLRGRRAIYRKTLRLGSRRTRVCRVALRAKIRKSRVGRVRRLKVRFDYSGTPELLPFRQTKTIRVRY